ncbi:hypothetical protein CORC01_05703 [Colletotrichum orchidophilum]|uniref:Uncharacterized protein n=1 Tax=Colletotrichum orchidophilum TaxID=1209926 RepID=A0A1G4BC95_9PEZI|nr:uncharacterized protein CORC01_05703 [Colletotrichum orchidophilum]OHE99013.1 hypothetical protein CORC01_05703 [Colletotrichum orchidophilum]
MSSPMAHLLAGLLLGAAQLTIGSPVADAPVVTVFTTDCPEPTVIDHGNQTYTLTVTNPGPAPTGVPPNPECPAGCAAAYDKCRGAPEANRATCAAEYAGCLGYNPFGPDGSLITPTACSSTPVTPTAPVTTPPASASTPTAPASDCPVECAAAYDKCRGAPEANRATCAAQYAGCLGYNPFGSNGFFITPTACSSTTVAPTASAITPTANGSAPVSSPTVPGKSSPSLIQTAAAGRASFVDVFAALSVCGLAALALL